MCAGAFPLAFGTGHMNRLTGMLHTLVAAVAAIVLAVAHVAVIDTLFVVALEVAVLINKIKPI